MRTTWKHRRLWTAGVGVLATTALSAGMLVVPPQPTAAAATAESAPRVPAAKSVGGKPFTAPPVPTVKRTVRPEAPTRADLPAGGSYTAPLSSSARDGATRPPGQPVQIRADKAPADPEDVTVTIADADTARRAGLHGVVFSVTRPPSKTTGAPVNLGVEVSYQSYADAFGGDWSQRLTLYRLDGCDTTTLTAACAPSPVKDAHNDPATSTLSGTTKVASGQTATFAAVAAASGPTGAYDATPLSPSSSWQVNLQSGDFSWSYPLRVPPSTGGPAPTLGLDYSSGSVDGRTASTNNQPSWVGEGFTFEPGFVERKYVTCADDMTGSNTTAKTYDQCWKTDNATLTLAGHSSELVRNGTGWALKNADGSKIERLTGGVTSDGEDEYWRLSTPDGMKYYFGIGKRYTADTIDTQSTFTMPVFGNQTGEPCRQSTFAASSCTQGWRWNLDYVVDPNGNTMTYQYARETNNYGRNNNTAVSSYVRGGYLTQIEYGERAGSEATTTAPMKVTFGVSERCLPSGTITCATSQLTSANASYWPDVPFDQICTSTTSCSGRTAPSFFTRKRLDHRHHQLPVRDRVQERRQVGPDPHLPRHRRRHLQGALAEVDHPHRARRRHRRHAGGDVPRDDDAQPGRRGSTTHAPMYKARMAAVDTDSGSGSASTTSRPSASPAATSPPAPRRTSSAACRCTGRSPATPTRR